MTKKVDQDLSTALRAAAAALRQRQSAAPTENEIFAYVNGELSAEKRQQVEEAISLDPEAAELARDFALFHEAATPGEAAYLSPNELAEDWEAIQARIAPRRFVAARQSAQPVTIRLLAVALAASLVLALSLAAWGFFERKGRFDAAKQLAAALEPQVNVDLYLLTEVVPRGSAPAEPPLTRLARGKQVYWLQLAPRERPILPSYRLEVRSLLDLAGAPVWTADRLLSRPDWTFSIALPRLAFGPGTYELRLVGEGGDRPLAVYRIEIPGS